MATETAIKDKLITNANLEVLKLYGDETYARKTDFDELSDIVSNLSTTTDGKVDSTDFNTLKAQVQSNTTSTETNLDLINALTATVGTKANSVDLTNLQTTVNNLSTTVSNKADTSALTSLKSTVDGLPVVQTGSTATVVTGGSASLDITFSKAFNSAPNVVAGIMTSSPSNSFVSVNNITKTGFTVYVFSENTYFSNSSTNKIGIRWIAVD